jgi:hypothetical protein
MAENLNERTDREQSRRMSLIARRPTVTAD